MRGYAGRTTLRSPDGHRETVTLPGRVRVRVGGQRQVRPVRGRPGRAERRFYRLLSAGWVVEATDRQQPGKDGAAASVQKPPEEVSQVAPATSESSEATHGGSEATGEVPDSPNAAEQGQQPNGHGHGQQAPQTSPQQQPQRGQRGRRGQGQAPRGQQRPAAVLRPQRTGSGQVWSPQPLTVTAQVRRQAHQSGQVLAQLVGARGARAVPAGTRVDPAELMVTLETGDNPLPALERPQQRPRSRVLVTADSSASCQDWSGVGRAWAVQLAGLDDVDVVHVDNFNGRLVSPDGTPLGDPGGLLDGVDVVVYLGDDDGRRLCGRYADAGALVVGLDNRCATVARPRVAERVRARGGGELVWVDRVSARDPQTWTRALQLALTHH